MKYREPNQDNIDKMMSVLNLEELDVSNSYPANGFLLTKKIYQNNTQQISVSYHNQPGTLTDLKPTDVIIIFRALRSKLKDHILDQMIDQYLEDPDHDLDVIRMQS
jgi:hypothetical protein